jgi:uncharacterized protein (TIGR03435 family)
MAASSHAQAVQPARTFEVASIKPSPPLDMAKVRSGQQRIGMKVDAARVDIGNLPLADIICASFKLKPYQVGGPGWRDLGPAGGPRFDIDATLPPGATEKDVPELLQALLAERFGLRFHREESEQPVYALIVGKNGHKMKPAPQEDSESARAPNDKAPEFRTDGAGGMTTRARGSMGNVNIRIQDGMVHMEADRVSMDRLAEKLTELSDRPIVNMTGLEGDFQVTLDIAVSEAINAARRAGVAMPEDAPPSGEASEPGGATIFQSVQKLGLKLDPRKVNITKMIIDHLEKVPSQD